jgi:hypothetical protein
MQQPKLSVLDRIIHTTSGKPVCCIFVQPIHLDGQLAPLNGKVKQGVPPVVIGCLLR